MDVIGKQRTSEFALKSIVFISICIIYAFSNVKELSIAIQFIFVSVTIAKVVMQKKLRITIHFIWMLLFIFWSFLITLFSEHSINSVIEVTNLFFKFLFYTSLIMFINTESRFYFVLKSLVIAGLILVTRVIILTPISDWGSNRLGFALDLNPNILGLSLSFAAIISVYLAISLKEYKYYNFTILFTLIGLLTGSKKVVLAIFGGVFILFYFRTGSKVKRINALLVLVFCVPLIYVLVMEVPLLYEVLGIRLEKAFMSSSEIDKSTLHRSMMAQEAWSVFKENPITGIGLENFRIYSDFNTYSHNNYMEILVSTGVVGFIIYYSLPLTITFLAFYNNKNNQAYSLIIAVMMVILILDIANVSYRQLITQVMIALSVSRLVNIEKK